MLKITDEIEKLLTMDDWVLECESPLEIKNQETDDVATGIAVEYIVFYLKFHDQLKKLYK